MTDPLASFFRLLRVSFGTAAELDCALSEPEWDAVLEIAKRQSLQGVCYYAMSILPMEQYPPRSVLVKWLPVCGTIAKKNEALLRESEQLCSFFAGRGFRSTILKGQGNAVYYPNADMRSPGDIDVWVEGETSALVALARETSKNGKVFYHHMDLKTPLSKAVELHFRPSWMFNPRTNRLLQRWFEEETDRQMQHTVNIGGVNLHTPTPSFNLVYQMVHIYRHVFAEGVGLRQVTDYAFLLKSTPDLRSREYALGVIKKLKMTEFAGALMYVLKTVLDMPDSMLLVKADPGRGRHLLDEILLGGNFGKYNPDVQKLVGSGNLLKRFTFHTFHNFSHYTDYPSEALWGPAFRIWQYFWIRKWSER